VESLAATDRQRWAKNTMKIIMLRSIAFAVVTVSIAWGISSLLFSIGGREPGEWNNVIGIILQMPGLFITNILIQNLSKATIIIITTIIQMILWTSIWYVIFHFKEKRENK
jgi:uncharacterized membrane protein YjjB (DUF3815 family)